MNVAKNESAWEELGYQPPSYTLPNEQKMERSLYQQEYARRCLDELRRMLREKTANGNLNKTGVIY